MKILITFFILLFSNSVIAKDITNTLWNVVNYDGNTEETNVEVYYEIFFLSDDRCYWKMKDYETSGKDVCTWAQINNKLFYQLNNFSEYNMTIDNNTMSGKGYYNTNAVVKVKGTLID